MFHDTIVNADDGKHSDSGMAWTTGTIGNENKTISRVDDLLAVSLVVCVDARAPSTTARGTLQRVNLPATVVLHLHLPSAPATNLPDACIA
jgi:hypothetical protein